MAKSKPIGVRFDDRILAKYPTLTPQKILNKLTENDLGSPEKFKVKQGKIKVQTDIPIKKLDLLRGFDEPKKYDFGDAKFLIIENFTEYRMQDKPKNKFEAIDWLKKKAAADEKIKEAWKNRHNV